MCIVADPARLQDTDESRHDQIEEAVEVKCRGIRYCCGHRGGGFVLRMKCFV